MSSTVRANVTMPGVQKWAEAHNIDIANTKSTITINDDGTYTLYTFLLNANGRRYVDPETNEAAVKPFTITPKYGLPTFAPA